MADEGGGEVGNGLVVGGEELHIWSEWSVIVTSAGVDVEVHVLEELLVTAPVIEGGELVGTHEEGEFRG